MLTSWKEGYDPPRKHIQKQRHYFVKGSSSQGYGFSSGHVWMWELDCEESWALKNWCFWWCWRRLLRVPLTARRSNQSILKEISPGCFLERMMLELKLQYFSYLTWGVDSMEKTLMLGEIRGRRKRGRERMRWLNGITDYMDLCFSELRELVMDTEAFYAAIHGVTDSDTTEWVKWTELISFQMSILETDNTFIKRCLSSYCSSVIWVLSTG